MKFILIFIIILAVFPNFISAQEKDLKKIYADVTTAINSTLLTKTNSIEMSGFLSYNYFSTKYSYDEERTQQIFQVEPVCAYFFIDNVSLGIDLSYLYQKTDYKSSNESTTLEQTFVGPIAKMYFGEKRMRPFILADYLFMVGDNYDGGELDFGAGVFYQVAGNFGINIFSKYGIIWSSQDSVDNQSRIFIGIGISSFIL